MRPAMSGRGAVAAGHPATVAAAREILEDGGNAFDAALAAMCATCVAEPVLSSLGGGGFLMAHEAGGRTTLYDFFVSTPFTRRATSEIDFHPILADFGTATQEFHVGPGAMATPGLIKGLFHCHRALGRVPMERLLEPAIRLAREGITLRAVDAYLFRIVGPILTLSAESRRIFSGGTGRLPGKTETLRYLDLADTFDALAHEGDDLFYRGEIGQRLIAFCEANGGQLTTHDLSAYQVEVRTPLDVGYHAARISLNAPPSSGGILIAFALKLLASRDMTEIGEATRAALLAEVMALTNRARIEENLRHALDDPARDAAAHLLEPALVRRYAREIKGRPPALRGTTHVSVADADGNLAALSISNGEGCGHILPGTGIMLNNMLGEDDLNPEGFHSWREGERMTSMMCPSIAEQSCGTLIALGTGGSNRIRTAILQVLINCLDLGMTLREAVEAPRLHVESGRSNLENGFAPAVAVALSERSETPIAWPKHNLFFGGVHAVARRSDGSFDAAGDPRRGGCAALV
jgi:gamma-glutamyltranspeptidase/glutathione hydrolase